MLLPCARVSPVMTTCTSLSVSLFLRRSARFGSHDLPMLSSSRSRRQARTRWREPRGTWAFSSQNFGFLNWQESFESQARRGCHCNSSSAVGLARWTEMYTIFTALTSYNNLLSSTNNIKSGLHGHFLTNYMLTVDYGVPSVTYTLFREQKLYCRQKSLL